MKAKLWSPMARTRSGQIGARWRGRGGCGGLWLIGGFAGRRESGGRGGKTSALCLAQRRAVDADSVAAVAQPAKQCLDQSLVAEEVRPFGVIEIGRDDRWPV